MALPFRRVFFEREEDEEGEKENVGCQCLGSRIIGVVYLQSAFARSRQ